MPGNPYPHRYKHGKQTSPIDFEQFIVAMEKPKKPFVRGDYDRSYLAFLYWFGVRKAEALERIPEDFIVKDGLLLVDASPKKRGEREPLEIPVDYPYVNLIVERVEATPLGVKLWRFSPKTAWKIVKRAMGEKYYPHFFRLNRATRFLDDPTTTLPEMKAWFGWKHAKTVDPYIGYSRRHIKTQRERLANELK